MRQSLKLLLITAMLALTSHAFALARLCVIVDGYSQWSGAKFIAYTEDEHHHKYAFTTLLAKRGQKVCKEVQGFGEFFMAAIGITSPILTGASTLASNPFSCKTPYRQILQDGDTVVMLFRDGQADFTGTSCKPPFNEQH